MNLEKHNIACIPLKIPSKDYEKRNLDVGCSYEPMTENSTKTGLKDMQMNIYFDVQKTSTLAPIWNKQNSYKYF